MLAVSSLQSTTSCTNHREDHTGDIDLYQPNALLDRLHRQMLDLAQVLIRLLVPKGEVDTSSGDAIQHPVGQGLMQMWGLDFFRALQIRNGARDTKYTVVGAGGQA